MVSRKGGGHVIGGLIYKQTGIRYKAKHMNILLLNQLSSGKFKREVINSRPHLLTDFIAIVGNSVMNGIFYPRDLVIASAKDLIGKFAPAYHPEIENQKASANHPLSINAHNVGAFVADVRVEGDNVIATIAIDEELAGRDDRGKQILSRIENGETIGCSTGLAWDCTEQDGIADGRKYKHVMNSIQWDHLAILLDEAPAGDKCYNIVNCTVNNQDDIIDDGKDSNQPKRPNMDLETLIKVLIANGKTALNPGDEPRLKAMSENDLASAIVNSIQVPETSLEQAKEIVASADLVVNSKSDLSDFDTFKAQKSEFTEFLAAKDQARKAVVDEIVANSKLESSALESMTNQQLNDLKDSLVQEQDYSARGTQFVQNRKTSDNNDFADYGV